MQEQITPDNISDLQVTERSNNGQFKKGCSGNPKGRPYGVRNKISFAIQQIFEEEAFAVAHKVVELAKSGDMTAIKLILERVYPAPKNKELYFSLPEINDREGIDKARNEIQQAFVIGEITATEAEKTMTFLAAEKKEMTSSLDFF